MAMQKNILVQTIQQQQVQTLSPVQLMAAQLTEMSLDALLQKVENECMENPWLESKSEPIASEGNEEDDSRYDYNSEDDIPDYLLKPVTEKKTAENWEWGDTFSFYDQLKNQVAEFELTDRQREILEYIIGSLDDDGLLRRPLYQLADEMSIYQNLDATEQEMEEVLHVLWQFDPPGIGARNLQECLLIQIQREEDNPHKELMEQVIELCYDDFMKKRWDRIQQRLKLSNLQVENLRENLLRLNPRPGTSLGEDSQRGSQQITPDFIVETDSYGNITLNLNDNKVPQLTISPDATAQQDLPYIREYVERGQMFIHAMAQRRDNMLRTMKAIIQMQRPFFLEGDESLLRPMILEDVAQKTGLSISTISRVSNNKFVQTAYGIFPLRWFFNTGATLDGDQVSVRQLKSALKEMIQQEDKNKPLSDDRLTSLLQEKGFETARRTVAKYREQLGFPVARLRKQ